MDVTQQSTGEKNLEKNLDSYNQLTTENKKHNNNMLACKSKFFQNYLLPNIQFNPILFIQRHIKTNSHIKALHIVRYNK